MQQPSLPVFTHSLLLSLAVCGLASGCTQNADFPMDAAEGEASSGGGDEASGGAQDDPGETGNDAPDPDATTDGQDSGQDDGGTGEPSPGGTDGEPGDDPGPDEEPCQDDPSLLCVGPAPSGWVGPVVTVSDASLTASHCGGAYPALATTAFTEFAAPAADCDCECGSPVGGGCSGSARLDTYAINWAHTGHPASNYASCYDSTNALQLDDGMLTDMNIGLPARFNLTNVVAEASGASCTPISTGSVPEAGFGARVDLCAPAELTPSCEGDTMCTPQPVAPFEGGVCVWREGLHECPGDSEYSAQSVYYRNYTDTRTCRECSCGTPSGSCDDAHANVFFTANLTDTTELPPDTCTMIDDHSDTTAVMYIPGDPTWAPCTPSAGGTLGLATANDAITVCCTP